MLIDLPPYCSFSKDYGKMVIYEWAKHEGFRYNPELPTYVFKNLRFFATSDNLEILVHKSYSCRIIEWFVNNFCRDYHSKTNKYSKCYFDVFNRGNIKMSFSGRDFSIGQLNFFRWAIKNGVINYIEKNKKQVIQMFGS